MKIQDFLEIIKHVDNETEIMILDEYDNFFHDYKTCHISDIEVEIVKRQDGATIVLIT